MDRTEDKPNELVEYARNRLREEILTNRLKALDSLSQVQLARELGISRTPLREAVRLLEYEGLTTVQFNRRVIVSGLTAEDLDSLYAQRIMLESLALHARIPKMDEQFFTASRARVMQMRKAEEEHDVESWSRVHRDFHLGLVLGTSRRVDQPIEQCFDHAERYRRFYLGDSDDNWRQTSADHMALQLACEAGDKAGAVHKLIEHYTCTAMSVLQQINPAFSPKLINAARMMARGLIFID
ncbi:GntR family transcriptional regulator [Yersinia enterocolitica]|nr:GntR family transcriptional regulator [Enterobacter hormaechei]ELI8127161.1 GntR family transcriptional regulator [Yersinia enterocolitica]